MASDLNERTYELGMTRELMDCSGSEAYAPDPQEEKKVGFDHALYTLHPFLTTLFPETNFYTGIDLYADMMKSILYKGNFPAVRCNVLIQYKVSKLLTRSNAKQWSDWGRRFYRYKINREQNNVLCAVSRKLGRRALVTYAAPCFSTFSAYFRYQTSKRLIEMSNFCKADNLKNHSHYTYISPGGIGKGHSESEDIESEKFHEMIAKAYDNQVYEFRENILHFGDAVDSALKGSRWGGDWIRFKKYYSEREESYPSGYLALPFLYYALGVDTYFVV